MGDNPRLFRQVTTAIAVLLCLGCVVLLLLSFRGTFTMKWFPLIFLIAGAMNILMAVVHFRRDEYRRNQKMAGVFNIVFCILSIGAAAVMAVCLWFG